MVMFTAKEYLDLLDESIEAHSGNLNELIKLQSSYDNKIDPLTWATNAQVPTAQHFTMTENILPPAMAGLFPETNGLQLIPNDDTTTPEQWIAAEWALWTQLTYVMQLQKEALPSVKDCMKLGIGYGIVEPHTFTPEEGKVITEGKTKTRVIGTGEEKTGIRYRYISAGRIIPYREGRDFDGPNAVPMFWFFDPHPLWDIEAMYDGSLPNGVDREELKGSIEEIRELAKDFANGGGNEFSKFAAIMDGVPDIYNRRNSKDNDAEPLSVPIIKVFEQPGTWTWIVPGRDNDGLVILRRESKGQRLQSGLVKWSAWPDGNRWFSMSTAEADRVRGFAYDLWFNFIIDQMDRAKSSVRVISKSAIPAGQRDIPDGEDVFITGSARDAASFLEPGKIDPALMGMGATISELGNKIQGHNDFMQHNVTRGGTEAFNSLLQTMQARELLGISILETGALTKIFSMVLNYMQILVPKEGITLRRAVFDSSQNKRIIESQTVTQEDLRHSFGLDLDLSTRRMLGGMSFEERVRMHEVVKDDPNVYPEMRDKLLPIPEAFAKRLWRSPEEREKIQQEDRDLDVISQLGGGGAGTPTQQPPTAPPPAPPI